MQLPCNTLPLTLSHYVPVSFTWSDRSTFFIIAKHGYWMKLAPASDFVPFLDQCKFRWSPATKSAPPKRENTISITRPLMFLLCFLGHVPSSPGHSQVDDEWTMVFRVFSRLFICFFLFGPKSRNGRVILVLQWSEAYLNLCQPLNHHPILLIFVQRCTVGHFSWHCHRYCVTPFFDHWSYYFTTVYLLFKEWSLLAFFSSPQVTDHSAMRWSVLWLNESKSKIPSQVHLQLVKNRSSGPYVP